MPEPWLRAPWAPPLCLLRKRSRSCPSTKTIGLCGQWRFRTDPTVVGVEQHWHEGDYSVNDWQSVVVPHTWQVALASVDYRGIAWYRRTFDVPIAWQHSAVRIEFEAVFHTAMVWINGRLAGEHARKGYTAFTFDITQFLRWGRPQYGCGACG